MQSHNYHNILHDPTKQIRLVELLPEPDRDDLRFNLPSFNLLNAPRFEVLSYIGQSGASEDVDCYGKIIKYNSLISRHLKTLRQSNAPLYFWIEELCINRANDEELRAASFNMPLVYRMSIGIRWCHFPDISRGGETMSFQPQSSGSILREFTLEAYSLDYSRSYNMYEGRFEMNHWGISKFPPYNLLKSQRDSHSANSRRLIFRYDGERDGPAVDGTVVDGTVVDTIKSTSSYMPPRRLCDHYNVGGDNFLFFAEWSEFALGSSSMTVSHEQTLLDFTDTVQARGCGHIWDYLETDRERRLESIHEFINYLEDENAKETPSLQIFYAACYPSHDRRFAITKEGRFCLVPEDTKAGDLVILIDGNGVPYICRTRKDGSGLDEIGEAYVHGFMGERTSPEQKA
ncbi:hypothetical protein IQ06DRAFT_49537 [Phaeosphaeriaceae sp. SRC1lsM3a]|nr:hypothetical protein IQ06DRAFT_49537 [Stagonospora sp. SRC1lsM3a]